MTLDHLVPELGNYEKPNRVDPLAYLDPTMRETIRQFQEREKSKPRIESILDLFSAYESPIKDMEIFTNDVMKRAREMAVEPPSAVQRRMIIDKLSEQNEMLSEQHKQDREQIELQKQEIDLLKKTLESLGILPSIDANTAKIAENTEKLQAWETHHLAATWKKEYPVLFAAISKLINIGYIEYFDSKFNFKMKKGCVGLVLNKCGYTDYKIAYPYILIDKEPAQLSTLQNCTKNAPPEQWEEIWEKIRAAIQAK